MLQTKDQDKTPEKRPVAAVAYRESESENLDKNIKSKSDEYCLKLT